MPDIIHCHSGRGSGEAALAIYNLFDIPYIVQEHNPIFLTGNISPDEKSRLRDCYKFASYCCPVSGRMVGIMKPLIEDSNKIKIIPNLLSRDFEGFIPLNRESHDIQQISIIARFNNNKNVEMGLRCFANIRLLMEAKLNIIGTGSKYAVLRKIAQDLCIDDDVQFHGHVSRESILNILGRSSILLLCSKSEPFGIPVIEALACGCRVVSTKCGGPEDISDYVDGIFLVEDNDDESMAKIALDLLNSPLTEKEKIQLRNNVIRVYGRDTICNQWINLYKNIFNQQL